MSLCGIRPGKILVADAGIPEHVTSMKTNAAPKTAREALFTGMPKHVQALRKDAHKHQRLKQRAEFKSRVLLGQVPANSRDAAGMV